MKYLVIDTESGSRHATSTLLTAYFLVVNDAFQHMGCLDLKLKPEGDDHYIVDAQGLATNGINIVNHDHDAITCKQAKPLLYEFLKMHSVSERLTPLGHATKGDIRRITDNLISKGSWDQFCTYHFIDTSVVLQFLRACGKMPEDEDGSIQALAAYFNIPPATWHVAKFDAEITMKIFQKMVELGR